MASSGQLRSLFYKSADRIQSDDYTSLSSADLLDAAERAGLHFDISTGSGAVFYMLGALATWANSDSSQSTTAPKKQAGVATSPSEPSTPSRPAPRRVDPLKPHQLRRSFWLCSGVGLERVLSSRPLDHLVGFSK